MPHELGEKKVMDGMSVFFESYPSEKGAVLDRLVTRDEKWIVYKNMVIKWAYVYGGKTPPYTSKAGNNYRIL